MVLTTEMKSKLTQLANRASTQLSEFDEALKQLFEDLKSIDPDLARRAEVKLIDPAIVAFMLFSPHNTLDGKSTMQVAIESGQDPLTIESKIDSIRVQAQSTEVSETPDFSALRKLRNSVKQVDTSEEPIAENDWETLVAALSNKPFAYRIEDYRGHNVAVVQSASQIEVALKKRGKHHETCIVFAVYPNGDEALIR